MTDNTPDAVDVIQADIVAAADWIGGDEGRWLRGDDPDYFLSSPNNHPLVQAFARHRQSFSSPAGGREEVKRLNGFRCHNCKDIAWTARDHAPDRCPTCMCRSFSAVYPSEADPINPDTLLAKRPAAEDQVREALEARDRIEAVAKAIVAYLARQDGVDGTWLMSESCPGGEPLTLAFIEQGLVNMAAVAEAAIAAMLQFAADAGPGVARGPGDDDGRHVASAR